MLLLAAVYLALQAPVVSDTSPFRALDLPTPSRVRSASGAPGSEYWQQRADYLIRAALDTAGSEIRGTERIHYENHSPDTLAFVWVQIEQNIFAKNSVTYALNQPPLHFAGGAVFDFTGKGFIGGITIERFTSAGRELRRTEYGTMMRVELPRPLAPRAAIDFEVAWHFPVPPYGGGRMGRIGIRLYEIGQWYPRMVVYDDVHGWNYVTNNPKNYDDPDNDWHGTHVTGAIGAAGNNQIGVTGVAWQVKLMVLKFLGAQTGSTADAVKAINYVLDQKRRGQNVRVINASWAGTSESLALKNAIIDAGNNGILFVCAAGNGAINSEGVDLESSPVYPAAWSADVPTIIAVAAANNTDSFASFSNYGLTRVQVAAPGVFTISTIPNGALRRYYFRTSRI